MGDCELELFIMKDHPLRLSPEAYGLRHPPAARSSHRCW
jgi:glyoxylase I family protein